MSATATMLPGERACVHCGYDLAGLAGGASCPECGLSQPAHPVSAERARFRSAGWRPVRGALAVTIACLGVASLAQAMVHRASPGGPDWGAVLTVCASLGAAPCAVVAWGVWRIWRTPGTRDLAAMCALRSLPWCAAPVAIGWLFHAAQRGDTGVPIGLGLMFGLPMAAARWNQLAMRAELPERLRTGLMTGAMVAACVVVTLVPVVVGAAVDELWP